MKKTILLLAMGLILTTTIAQQQMLVYDFSDELNEKQKNGPALVILGTGEFTTDYLSKFDIEKTVYQFDKNCGLSFDDSETDFLAEGSYSIELYFKFFEYNRWSRVIDFKNRQTDGGAYIYYNEIAFYPSRTSSGAELTAGEYLHYVITRDADTKEVKIYNEGNLYLEFTDSKNEAVYNDSKKIHFFQDDLVVRNEASPGAIAFLRIYNYPITADDVMGNYEDYSSVEKQELSENIISPNPVKETLRIQPTIAAKYDYYYIYDLNGKTLHAGKLNDHQIDVQHLPVGVYTLQLAGEHIKPITSRFIKE